MFESRQFLHTQSSAFLSQVSWHYSMWELGDRTSFLISDVTWLFRIWRMLGRAKQKTSASPFSFCLPHAEEPYILQIHSSMVVTDR